MVIDVEIGAGKVIMLAKMNVEDLCLQGVPQTINYIELKTNKERESVIDFNNLYGRTYQHTFLQCHLAGVKKFVSVGGAKAAFLRKPTSLR